MLNLGQLETAYAFVGAYSMNPRISTRELHRKHSHYSNRDSTTRFLKRLRNDEIIIGPRIYCNTGIDVILLEGVPVSLSYFDEQKKDPSITYAVSFLGSHSFMCFKKGTRTLKYAEAIMPSFPAKTSIDKMTLTEIGKLPIDPFPNRWDDLDLKVFQLMIDPLVSFQKVGTELGVSWHTAKNRFEKILNDCKTWIAFFPRGYDNYIQTFLTFRTEYEISLRKELQKLDRTNYLYKFDNTIILNLFSDKITDHYTFRKWEKMELIRDLKVSIPVEWHKP